MNHGSHLVRGLMLAGQQRHEQAIEEFRQHLLEDPNDPHGHASLAVSLSELEHFQKATEHAQRGVGLAPDIADTHFALARVMYDRNRYPEAKTAVDEALRLDPGEPWHYYLRGGIAADENRWKDALSDAEAGLQIDPEHEACLNLKAMSLVKLGRDAHAGAALEAAMNRNPDNAQTHANQGWRMLETGQPKQAMQHFREALRLEPDMEWARAGILEAMKARHFIYRIFLRYLLWMSRMTPGTQWGIIVGGYVAYRIAMTLTDQGGIFLLLIPLILLYIGFALLTWFAQPLFNLLLRLNPFGRLALSDDERHGSTLFGFGVLLAMSAAVGWIIGLWNGNEDLAGWGQLSTIFTVLLLIPLSSIFQIRAGQRRWTMAAVTAGLFSIGVWCLWNVRRADMAVDEALKAEFAGTAQGMSTLFLLGIIGSQFLANYLRSTRPRL